MAKKIKRAGVFLALLIALSAGTSALADGERLLVPVGRTVGIELSTDGLMVAGYSKVKTEDGEKCPAEVSGIQPGDVLLSLDGREVKSAEDFREAAAELDGGNACVLLRRGNRLIQYTVSPVMNLEGQWRLGLWLRDGASGIGTVTYYDPETGAFGALGHSIADASTGALMPLREGKLCYASVTGVRRGESGAAGELRGEFDLNRLVGEIGANTPRGIFGTLFEAPDGAALPCAKSGELKAGAAVILSNVEGDGVREYAVTVDYCGNPFDGRLSVTVTDPELLALTGGIVQGMSGSPIIQDGKLVGAVTHVLLSDPSRGYGITIESMLSAAETGEKAA